MTKTGAGQVAALIDRSQTAIEAQLAHLMDADKTRLIAATEVIRECLSDQQPATASAVTFRDLKIGDIGLIASRHGVLYAREHGFDDSFEPAVADILLAFQRNRRPEVERAFIATRDDQMLGSIFCMRVTDQLAKLRLFYLEPAARGSGVGAANAKGLYELCPRRGISADGALDP